MSGRSGRRRGSQNPGTACGAASAGGFTTVCAPAGSLPAPSISAAAQDSPASRRRTVFSARGLMGWRGIDRQFVTELDGLIDHPALESRAVLGLLPLELAYKYRFRSVAAS